MGNDTGFLEHSKQDVPRRPIAERIKDFREYDVHYSESEIQCKPLAVWTVASLSVTTVVH